MDKKEVARLLRKKKPTGIDLGRLYVAQESNRIKHIYGTEESPPLYDIDVYHDSVRKLVSTKDKNTLESYIYASECFLQLANEAMKYYAGFEDGYNQLMVRLHVVCNAEIAEAQANSVPMTMTQEEYDALYEKAQQYCRSQIEALDSVVLDVLSSAFGKERQPFPEYVQKELDALRNTKEVDKEVLQMYELGAFNGLHKIEETGDLVTRRDLVKWRLDWRRSMRASDAFLDLTRLFFHGKEECLKAFKKIPIIRSMLSVDTDRFFKLFEDYLYFRDISTESSIIENVLDNFLSGGKKLSSFVQLPTGSVTKYNILETIMERDQHPPERMVLYYYDAFEKTAPDVLKEKFSGVWDAVERYIKEVHPSDQYTWDSLSKAGFVIYKNKVVPSPSDLAVCYTATDDWRHKERIAKNGIAIIRPETQQKGNAYQDTVQPDVFSLYRGITYVDEQEKKTIRRAIDYVTAGACRVFDMDTTFNVMSDVFGTSVLQWLNAGDKVESRVKDIQTALYFSYLKMQGTPEIKRYKRALYKETFQDFDLNFLASPSATAKKWQREIKGSIGSEDLQDRKRITIVIDGLIQALYENRK